MRWPRRACAAWIAWQIVGDRGGFPAAHRLAACEAREGTHQTAARPADISVGILSIPKRICRRGSSRTENGHECQGGPPQGVQCLSRGTWLVFGQVLPEGKGRSETDTPRVRPTPEDEMTARQHPPQPIKRTSPRLQLVKQRLERSFDPSPHDVAHGPLQARRTFCISFSEYQSWLSESS